MAEHAIILLSTALCVVVLILYQLISHLIEVSGFPYLHESGAAILLGAFSGGIIFLIEQEAITFSESIFFYYILPPIIFAAGFTLKQKNFFRNIGYIVLFGLTGTLLSFIVLTMFIMFYNSNGILNKEHELTTIECMLLACVLSATDTVAAMTIVKPKYYPVLNSVLFGEGVVNDAISILLFKITSAMINAEPDDTQMDVSVGTFLSLMWQFTYLCTLSILIGIFFGLLCALLFKKNPRLRESPIKEVSIIILMGYLSYIVAEIFDISGIMTLFICGLTMGRYTFYNISEESQHGTKLACEVLGNGAEAFVFAYLGLSVYSFSGVSFSFLFSFMTLIACIVARACSIFGTSFIFWLFKRKNFRLELRQLTLIWFSGCIRGAIAFALCLQIETEGRSILVSTTLAIVLTTTLILSAMMPSFANWLGFVNVDPDATPQYRELLESRQLTSQKDIKVTPRKDSEQEHEGCIHRWWKSFDLHYVQPYFGGQDYDNGSQSADQSPRLPDHFHNLDNNFSVFSVHQKFAVSSKTSAKETELEESKEREAESSTQPGTIGSSNYKLEEGQ